MPLKTVFAWTARGVALAGFCIFLVSVQPAALGADLSAIRKGSVRGLDGRRIDLAAPAHGATVLIFYSTECPISNSYSPTFATLAHSFPAGSVKWVGACVDPDLTDKEVETHARDFNLKFPVMRDRRGALARKLGATITPEAFVIDAEGKVRYHGRIDDQFVARRKRNANPSTSELKRRNRGGLERQGGEGARGRGRRLSVARGSGSRGTTDLLQGRRVDPSKKLPGMPSAGAGGSVLAGDLRTGAKTCLRYRRCGRGPRDAAMEG